MTQLKIATYNIHKGFSHFNQSLVIHTLREQLRLLNADLIFLQEVQGEHTQHAVRHENWPTQPQYEYLADSIWHDVAYGKNAIYQHGHHGNAILSRHSIVAWENQDVSCNKFERRGILHGEIALPAWPDTLHCFCVHLGLFAHNRRTQLIGLRQRIEQTIAPHAPLIIAGDFNDWRHQAQTELCQLLGLQEVFQTLHGQLARSFPANFPLLALDRIYVRGFHISHAQVHHGLPWSRLSDHAPLSAELIRL